MQSHQIMQSHQNWVRKIVTGGLVTSLSWLGMAVPSPPIASAQRCLQPQATPPTAATRSYRHTEPPFTIAIPGNYRAMGTQFGIEIMDPATFTWLQCTLQARQPTDKPSPLTIRINPIWSPQADLTTLVRQAHPWLAVYEPTFEENTLAGQPALTYTYDHDLYNATIVNYAIATPDRRYLITFTANQGQPLLGMALTTFQWDAGP